MENWNVGTNAMPKSSSAVIEWARDTAASGGASIRAHARAPSTHASAMAVPSMRKSVSFLAEK